MEIFYIPLNAEAKHGWTIPIPRDGEKEFSNRLDAPAFARKLAQEESSIKRESNYQARKQLPLRGGW
ncbi:hypothetical protein [Rhodanobacter sp. A1T4]|uniref:hypothetical protein n=1 Tax=Rhodanobacter sp. A1T4 TaxID=2723087 RepID=UPI00161D07FA|nr:hypothetical protein [Rhodanobacter sp. A1T4]MBB6249019.1 hypothetical protein [Rhodanobacter sp. A1T4]